MAGSLGLRTFMQVRAALSQWKGLLVAERARGRKERAGGEQVKSAADEGFPEALDFQSWRFRVSPGMINLVTAMLETSARKLETGAWQGRKLRA